MVQSKFRDGRGAWLAIAMLLVFAISAHAFVMAAPTFYTRMMPIAAPASAWWEDAAASCAGAYSRRIVAGCSVTMAMRGDIPMLPLIALAMTSAIAAFTRILRSRFLRWQWPPGRRRAFLQVFLC